MFPGLLSLKHKKIEVRRGLSTFRTSIVNQHSMATFNFLLDITIFSGDNSPMKCDYFRIIEEVPRYAYCC